MPSVFPRLVCALLAIAACTAHAQAGKWARGTPPAEMRGARAPVQLEGTLSRFLINPLGRIDQLLLDDGTLICLPPSLSEGAAQFARPGDRVRAIVAEPHGRGDVHARALINVESGRSLLDAPPALPASPTPRLDDLRIEGKIVRLLGSERRPRGALLEDGAVVRFSPRLAHRNRMLLQPGAKIRVDGVGTRNEYGIAIEAFSLERLPD